MPGSTQSWLHEAYSSSCLTIFHKVTQRWWKMYMRKWLCTIFGQEKSLNLQGSRSPIPSHSRLVFTFMWPLPASAVQQKYGSNGRVNVCATISMYRRSFSSLLPLRWGRMPSGTKANAARVFFQRTSEQLLFAVLCFGVQCAMHRWAWRVSAERMRPYKRNYYWMQCEWKRYWRADSGARHDANHNFFSSSFIRIRGAHAAEERVEHT